MEVQNLAVSSVKLWRSGRRVTHADEAHEGSHVWNLETVVEHELEHEICPKVRKNFIDERHYKTLDMVIEGLQRKIGKCSSRN